MMKNLAAAQIVAAALGCACIVPACAASPTKAPAAKAQASRERPPTDKALKAKIARLEAEVARLRTQLAAAQEQLRLVQAPKKEIPPVLNFSAKTIQGKDVDLSQYAGKTVVIVNTASKCGYTKQLKALQSLYAENKDKGLVVLGFPSASFNQELGSDAEVSLFCEKNYGVTFPMFATTPVTGEAKAPLFKYLTDAGTNPESPGEIGWNFEKFVIDPSGKIAARFKSNVAPDSPEFTQAVEKAMAKAG